MLYYFIGIKGSGMSSLAQIMHELGYTVTSLKRIRIEKITIDGLKIGQYRELTEKEKENLYETVGLK